jgi:hypothetical protein
MWSIVAIGSDGFLLHERRSVGALTHPLETKPLWIVEIF